MKLSICQSKTVYFFEVWEFLFVLRRGVLEHFLGLLVMLNLVFKHFIVYRACTAESLYKELFLLVSWIDSEKKSCVLHTNNNFIFVPESECIPSLFQVVRLRLSEDRNSDSRTALSIISL